MGQSDETALTSRQHRQPSILVLTTSYPSSPDDPSGVFIAKLLTAIGKRGYRVTVVAPSNGTFYGRQTIEGVEQVRFGYCYPRSLERLTVGGGGIPENMARSMLARIQLVPMMLAFLAVGLRELRTCDLIYSNWLGAGIIGATLNLLTGKPLVVSFRGDDGYLARERRLWRVLTHWVTSRAGAVAPVSAELLEILRGLGVPAEKSHLPRFGVDTEMFRPPALPRQSDRVNLLFVGSLIDRKGLHDLLEALADPVFGCVRLVVVGEGPNETNLRQLSRRHGIDGRTEWRGVVPPVEVARLMRSADILCLPSYMEGRPNVVNEAMASGLPVVATRIGGIPDMVREGETALLFNAGDVAHLRACLNVLVADRGLRSRMGAAGRRFLVESGVSWDATAEDFDRFFAELLKPAST